MATYDDSIGTLGGFWLDDGTTIELSLNDIGAPTKCYAFLEEIQKLFTTTMDIGPIPIGTKYGWSVEDMCWYYFVDDDTCYSTEYIGTLPL